MTWSVFVTGWSVVAVAALAGGSLLFRSARAVTDPDQARSAAMWLIGTLPSCVGLALLAAEPLVGRGVVGVVLGLPLGAGTLVGLLIFLASAFTTEAPRDRLAWASVRVVQLASWSAGAVMATARVLDV